jgi:3-deoxy-D-manno-octulosonic-acid transferase
MKRDSIKENVLIIDNIGILKYLYKYCNAAYIGGGFGKGIHNISEAAACSIPVLFGPNYLKFIEAKELIDMKLAKNISTFKEFSNEVNLFVPLYSKDLAINHFKKKESAVNKIMSLIFKK